ncbi:MAG: Malto-oligosyltrehalose synthase, partial [Variovorax sp.]|nr:Malto-oligosyltrehalose synthase [Variovorax sp.]
PRSYPSVLEDAARRIADADLGPGLASIASAFGHLPGPDAAQPEAMAERERDRKLLKARLARLVARQPEVAQALAEAVAALNLDSARDALHALIEAQAYRLAYWRVAADEINYRRFFDINELAALRMERAEVFEATQSFALDLAAAGQVDGLRIDHPDGLYDPAQYFRRLQEGFARRAGFALAAPGSEGRPARPLYVVAEKIAAPHEEVPEGWHIHGTTGYRFANVANGVLVDTAAAERFARTWRRFTGVEQSFEALARGAKRDIMRTALASELTVLATGLLRIARADRRTRDYTLNALRRALAEVAACLPVYRTYIVERPSAQDVRYVDWAVDEARRHSDAADTSVFDFVRHTLLGEAVEGAGAALRERVRGLAIRFQQFSAPVAAKGVEDTAFYRYFPLSSLNEVGGEPALFGLDVDAFHEAGADRAARWPHTMLATSTHDNKRSEDVRNRINVLSEMPATWRLALRRWQRLNAPARQASGPDAAEMPSGADEYLLYQTLLGTLPAGGLDAAGLGAYADRIVHYMLKAAREAKLRTRWTQPDEAYEAALERFVRTLLARPGGNPFLDDLQALGATLAWYGALNSLTLTLLKYGSPGVPDLYQGNELMDLSLVDPDNRRPVDYGLRARLLAEQAQGARAPDLATFANELAAAPQDGRAKLWITWRMLSWRREQPTLWRDGAYAALAVQGEHAAHVIAFERRQADEALVVIAGRLFFGLAGRGAVKSGAQAAATAAGESLALALRALPLGAAAWRDTAVALPGWPEGGRFENVLTGEVLALERGVLRMADAFASFPGAALRPL